MGSYQSLLDGSLLAQILVLQNLALIKLPSNLQYPPYNESTIASLVLSNKL